MTSVCDVFGGSTTSVFSISIAPTIRAFWRIYSRAFKYRLGNVLEVALLLILGVLWNYEDGGLIYQGE